MIAEELKLIITAETDRAIQQLKDFKGATDNATGAGMSLNQAFFQFTTGINQALEILGKVGRTMREVMEAAEAAATINQLNAAFRNIADKAGVSAEDLLDSMRAASEGTIKTVDLMKAASMANLFGLPMEKLGELMKIARASSIATGQDMTFMFDSIVKGIGRASPMIIDNLGIKVNLGEVTEKFAASIGKEADALTDSERSMALLNAVLENGKQIIDKVGDSASNDSVKFAKFRVAISEAKDEMAKDTIPVMSSLAAGAGELASQFVETKQRSDAIDASIKALGSSANETGQEVGLLTKALAFLVGQMAKSPSLSLPEFRKDKMLPVPDVSVDVPKTSMEQMKLLKDRITAVTQANGELNLSFQVQSDMLGTEYTDSFLKATEASREHIKAIEAQKQVYAELVDSISPFLTAMGTSLVDAAAGLDDFKSAIKAAVVGMLQMLGKQELVIAMIRMAHGNFISAGKHAAAGAAAYVAAGVVNAMAEGGIVTQPTTALIGEAGPEAVIPLDKMGGFGTHIHYHIAGNMMREEDFYRRSHAYSQGAQRGY